MNIYCAAAEVSEHLMPFYVGLDKWIIVIVIAIVFALFWIHHKAKSPMYDNDDDSDDYKFCEDEDDYYLE